MDDEERKHHWPPKQCYYCGKPAVAGCDGVEHYNAALVDGVPRVSLRDPDAVEWCARPLCDDHSTQVGMTTKRGRVDTIDYCPKHLKKEKHGIRPEFVIQDYVAHQPECEVVEL